MAVVVSSLLISVAVFCIFLHRVVKRRFRALEGGLPVAYQQAIAAPPDESDKPRLIALAVDLTRKQHCTIALENLTAAERRLALHAYGIEELPMWINRCAWLGLHSTERVLMQQLYHIKTSRPMKPERHFGAIRKEQALRNTGTPLRP